MLRTGLEPAHPFGHQPLKIAEAIIRACKGLQQNASICSNYRRGIEIGQVNVQGLAAVCRDCEKNKVTDNVTVRQDRQTRTYAIAEFAVRGTHTLVFFVRGGTVA